ncbi:MAG: FAD/NAD(P)-binding protein [Gammaproteobacteria bacterium]
MNENPHLPATAEIIARQQESPTIVSLKLQFRDPDIARAYHFTPGQFNMMYLFGIGEIPISIVSDPDKPTTLTHAIRDVGRVTHGLTRLQVGDRIGLRGPFGRGWPLEAAQGRDIMIVTGGLGCAPVVSVINYILRRREQYGRLIILQGVKHSSDLIWRERYAAWAKHPHTQVLLAADVSAGHWPWYTGPITLLFEHVHFDPLNTLVMMCGPERMISASADLLEQRGINGDSIWISVERNMQCAVGQCGHCQLGPDFVCRDGPVFRYSDISELFVKHGY